MFRMLFCFIFNFILIPDLFLFRWSLTLILALIAQSWVFEYDVEGKNSLWCSALVILLMIVSNLFNVRETILRVLKKSVSISREVFMKNLLSTECIRDIVIFKSIEGLENSVAMEFDVKKVRLVLSEAGLHDQVEPVLLFIKQESKEKTLIYPESHMNLPFESMYDMESLAQRSPQLSPRPSNDKIVLSNQQS
jgi:hypothetical protein